jgi:4-hydroxyphenylpyruvate dioxygenase
MQSKGLNRIVDENREKDLFKVNSFHHLEWFVGDAQNVTNMFKIGMGFKTVAQSRHETGNHSYASYVIQSANVKWVITTPYMSEFEHPSNNPPLPNFDSKHVSEFVTKHGSGVGVIGINVDDAAEAYRLSTENGATGVLEPTELKRDNEEGSVVISEIFCYGDTKIRFYESRGYKGALFPGYVPVEDTKGYDYGLYRMDHVVGNVYNMDEAINNLKSWLGFHTFAKFTKEDIQTEYTSLNSEVLSNDQENVLLPINEPAKKKRESQITEYLKAYNGPGVQHIAIFTPSILDTVEMMRKAPIGFEFIPTPHTYYDDEKVKAIIAEHLQPDAEQQLKEFGILADEDGEGVLLQIFTKPLFDRPTIFVEVIQRVCHGEVIDKAGCGGFGKGNFRALFESIERLQAERDMLLEEPTAYQ